MQQLAQTRTYQEGDRTVFLSRGNRAPGDPPFIQVLNSLDSDWETIPANVLKMTYRNDNNNLIRTTIEVGVPTHMTLNSYCAVRLVLKPDERGTVKQRLYMRCTAIKKGLNYILVCNDKPITQPIGRMPDGMVGGW